MNQKNELIHKCEKVMRVLFYILAFFLPISSAMCELIFGLLMICFITKRTLWGGAHRIVVAQRYIPDIGFLNKPMAAFVVAGGISVVFSQLFVRSLSGYFFEFLQNILYACFFTECFKDRKHFRTFINICIISAGLVCVNGFWQYFHDKGFLLGREITERRRILSSLKHTNDFGAYLIVIIGVLQGYILASHKKIQSRLKLAAPVMRKIFLHKSFVLVVYIAALICLGLTFSRGAWVGYIVTVLSSVVLLRDKKGLIFLIVLALFIAYFSPQLKQKRNVTFMTDNYAHSSAVLEKQKQKVKVKLMKFGASGRSLMWKRAVEKIKERPIKGSGWNTYTELAETSKFPHNSYLRLTAETGALGLLTFLILIGTLVVRVFIECTRIDSLYYRYLLIGISSGLFGFLTQSLVDTHFYSIQLATLMWLSIGMIVAIIQNSSSQQT